MIRKDRICNLQGETTMASKMKKMKLIRKRKRTKMGKKRKRLLRIHGSTPSFPLHPEDESPSATG
ncbi:MAG: hypothetical protein D6812_05310 [Deltaproteobacteria bacterium]|nr:MAG: hypothetical protein D6812_05310 [Deltaproteobacteria bacterium]